MSAENPNKTLWRESALPAVLVSNAISSTLAREVRSRLEQARYTRYSRLDRGSYDSVERVDEPELALVIAAIASDISGRELQPKELRAARLRAGDFILLRHDRVYEHRPVEVTVDLSATTASGAEVHYRHRGQHYFTFPSVPGSLAIVERAPTVMCNHTYVSKLQPEAEIVRLVALLQ